MKIEIVFDKEFTAVLTELAWSIGDSIKQAIQQPQPISQPIQQPQPISQPTPVPQPTQPVPTQPTQPVTSQPVQQPMPVTSQPIQQPTQPIQQPTQPTQPVTTQPVPQPTPVPTQKVVYNHQQLAVAAIQLKDAGKMHEIQDLIKKYGINSIMELKPEQFESFAQDLIAKGVKF